MPVTLINVFSVPKAKEDEFVKWWQDIKVDITKQPGYISGKFHKSIKPDSKFNFINVALWENEDVYWKAYEKSVTPMKAMLGQLNIEMTPALYNVLFEY
ncbi:MAG: antibiotic biosynthesis monooxygenase [Nitrospira sp. LK70]|nr:antibiotic biosynthesis monooxygenase [Nitrospira sp.]NGZ12015.1 antibiotic biosynthesis monooxygenase [Nitrospira sp. LK70]